MHPVLKTPELVLQIFPHLCSPRNLSASNLKLTREERVCLLAVALTCSSFNRPALDLLWFFMSDLVPLFKVLSNFSLKKVASGFISGPFNSGDLQHFNSYATRIRSFQAGVQSYDLSPAILRMMYANSGIGLLTSLGQLSFHDTLPDESLLFLLHPGLLELVFNLPVFSIWNPFGTTAFFQFLPEKCPNIRRLEIVNEDPNEKSLTSIYQLNKLEHVHISGKFDVGWSHTFNLKPHFLSLFSSTVLSYIKLGSQSPFSCLPIHARFSPVRLPSLEFLELFIELDSLVSMDGHVLGSNALPGLRTLQLRFSPPKIPLLVVEGKWAAFCVSLFRIAPNIRNITMTSTFQIAFPFSNFIQATSPRLQSLTISPEVFYLKQIDITLLSHFTPSLHSLSYVTSKDIYLGSSVLVDIASTLTTLSELSISIESLEYSSINTLPTSDNRLAKLTIFARRPPANPSQAASCVQRLFPNLNNFSMSSKGFLSGYMCSVVQSTLKTLWRVRDDERVRRQSIVDI